MTTKLSDEDAVAIWGDPLELYYVYNRDLDVDSNVRAVLQLIPERQNLQDEITREMSQILSDPSRFKGGEMAFFWGDEGDIKILLLKAKSLGIPVVARWAVSRERFTLDDS